jgi:hypothetical protein
VTTFSNCVRSKLQTAGTLCSPSMMRNELNHPALRGRCRELTQEVFMPQAQGRIINPQTDNVAFL